MRPYLQVTYRRGRPFAAYLHLERKPDDRAARSEQSEHGIVIDFTADDRPIGVEFTAPAEVTLAILNGILTKLHQEPLVAEDLIPLAAA